MGLKFDTLLAQLSGEHIGVRACLEELESEADACGKRMNGTPVQNAFGVLDEHVCALQRVLADHYEWEECSSLYRVLPLERPELAPRLDRLLAQHDAIKCELDEALACVRSANREQAAERVHQLARSIRRHEAEENAVLQEAYARDMGGGD